MAHTVYFGGELFSAKHLLGNAALAEAVFSRSDGRYVPLLPQNLAQTHRSAHAIRDADLLALLSCDLGLFHYDGPELDSGTVVEFMMAKFADRPAVLLRTDSRSGGDQPAGGEPWNLMTSFYPRTRSVVMDAMALYHEELGRAAPHATAAADDPRQSLEQRHATTAAAATTARIADAVVAALDEVRATSPTLPPSCRPAVDEWLALLPGLLPETHERVAAELRRQRELEPGTGVHMNVA